MKLQSLSVLISTMLMVSSAGAAEVYNKDGNKLNLYGKLNGMHHFSDDDDKNGDYSSIHYGIQGETNISDGVTGFGTWEHEGGLNKTESASAKDNYTRLGFVGIKLTDIGSIDYGRNYGVLYDVGAWTDVMPAFGGENSITDNFLAGRASNVLTYRNSNFFGMVDGLNFALQYQGKNESKKNNIHTDRGLKEKNGTGYGVSLTYDVGNNVSVGATYNNSKHIFVQQEKAPVGVSSPTNKDKKNIDGYSFGMKYDAYNLYLAALYSATRNMTPYGDFSSSNTVNDEIYGFAKKARNLELIAQYQFDFGPRPSIGYLQSRIDSNHNGDKHQNIKKYVEVGASYKFNKNMLTFIDYRINLLSKNKFISTTKISTDNIVAFGMTYIF
ncbi:MAG: porin [Sodalis sp. (in: enterobacteria)]